MDSDLIAREVNQTAIREYLFYGCAGNHSIEAHTSKGDRPSESFQKLGGIG